MRGVQGWFSGRPRGSHNLTPEEAEIMAAEITAPSWAESLTRGTNTMRDKQMKRQAFNELLQGLDPGAANLVGGKGAIRNAYELSQFLQPPEPEFDIWQALGDAGRAIAADDNTGGWGSIANAGMAGFNLQNVSLAERKRARQAAANEMFLELLSDSMPSNRTGQGVGLGANPPGFENWPTRSEDERNRLWLNYYDQLAAEGTLLNPSQLQHVGTLYSKLQGMTKSSRINPENPSFEQDIFTATTPMAGTVSPQLYSQLESIGLGPDTRVISEQERERSAGQQKSIRSAFSTRVAVKDLRRVLEENEGDLPNTSIALSSIPGFGNLTDYGRAANKYKLAVENYLREISGATINEAELPRLVQHFTPAITDTYDQALYKIDLLEELSKAVEAQLDWDPLTNPMDAEKWLEERGTPDYLQSSEERAAVEREREIADILDEREQNYIDDLAEGRTPAPHYDTDLDLRRAWAERKRQIDADTGRTGPVQQPTTTPRPTTTERVPPTQTPATTTERVPPTQPTRPERTTARPRTTTRTPPPNTPAETTERVRPGLDNNRNRANKRAEFEKVIREKGDVISENYLGMIELGAQDVSIFTNMQAVGFIPEDWTLEDFREFIKLMGEGVE